MQYLHAIQATNAAAQPAWQTICTGDQVEEYDGTAADYGREVLANYIDDNEIAATDDDGNPLLRVLVAFADDDAPFASADNRAAVIEADDLKVPSPEIVAVEAARDDKLRASLLDRLADDALEGALSAARGAGHGANRLAELVYPAVSRPIALRMMRAG
ncbi:hypothetical protein ACTWP5_27480 [Streptomyces sp. 4N509B]|uniref:hypothetical protein n=1 Tax=Streptomyces sp. 4N509B TaxID=3457413 RepID=UPI003FD4348E